MKLIYQYMAIFFNFSPTSNHLHPLQVENCDSNSRLVVDEDDNGKFRLETVKDAERSDARCRKVSISWQLSMIFFLILQPSPSPGNWMMPPPPPLPISRSNVVGHKQASWSADRAERGHGEDGGRSLPVPTRIQGDLHVPGSPPEEGRITIRAVWTWGRNCARLDFKSFHFMSLHVNAEVCCREKLKNNNCLLFKSPPFVFSKDFN